MSFYWSGQIRSMLTDSGLDALDSHTVWDGQEFARLHTARSLEPGVTFPQVDLGRRNWQVGDRQLVPVFLFFRMLDPELQVSFPVAELKLSGEPRVFEGTRCLVLRWSWRRALYVAPKFGFAPVVINTYAGDRETIRSQLQIEYQRDEEFGWVPAGWTSISRDREGRLKSMNRASVVRYAINPEVPEEEFRLDIPDNAVIVDEREPESSTKSIQRPSGERIPVANTGMTYRQKLQATEQVERQRSRRRWMVIGLVLGSAVSATLGIVGYRVLGRSRG